MSKLSVRRRRRAALRETIQERSGGLCEWPGCVQVGREQAHLHSIGMGGRPSADVLDNVMWACWDHARMSDGLYGSGGRRQYEASHRRLLGADWKLLRETGALAWERAEALTVIIRRT